MIIALVGSTASGKSELAVHIARKYNAEILSCDSLLVYRHLKIGTAKPEPHELLENPHHGIDLVEPNEDFTAGDYVRYARAVINDLYNKKKKVLIVGGTGFYLKALLCGTWDAPPTQPKLREKIEVNSTENLYSLLQKQDPKYAEKIKSNDRYRIVRALEIIESSGKTVTEISLGQMQNPLPYSVHIIGIQRGKLELERRIIERTNRMFSQGLIEETKILIKYYGENNRALSCVGYKEAQLFLKEKLNLTECRERVMISTRQLAKKQKTFFKTFPLPIHWYLLPAQSDELLKQVEVLWPS